MGMLQRLYEDKQGERGDRREDSRQKLSRKGFSIGDFYAVKIFFCLKKIDIFMLLCRNAVR